MRRRYRRIRVCRRYVDSVFYFFRAFKPDFGWLDYCELAIALALVIVSVFEHYRGRQLKLKQGMLSVCNGCRSENFRRSEVQMSVIDDEACQVLFYDGE